MIKPHEWTNGGDNVLVVKCCDFRGRGHDEYDWNDKVNADVGDKWNSKPVCDDGGFYGWAWGFFVGDGRDPDALGLWAVYAVKPDDLVCVEGGKTKWRRGARVFWGTQAEAMAYTMTGRVALVEKNSSGSASATGWRGSASATGWSGSASATGESGIAAITVADEDSVVESGPGGICAVIGEKVQWKVHVDSVLIQRWQEGDKFKIAVLHPKELKLKTGQIVKVNKGSVEK
jgi:hypothetical protein